MAMAVTSCAVPVADTDNGLDLLTWVGYAHPRPRLGSSPCPTLARVGKYDAWHPLFEDLEGEQALFDLDQLEALSGVQLPPSAREHDAWWWSGHHHAVWAQHGWRATPRLSTNEVVFRRVEAGAEAPIPEAAPSSDAEIVGLVLVGCVSSKLDHPAPAKDLYISDLWRKRRHYAEQSRLPWAILSAEYGLVEPDEVIAPYDRYLEHQSAEYRRSWSDGAAMAVIDKCRRLGTTSVEIHAGKAYVESGLEQHLADTGIVVIRPLQHYRRGEQLAWYNSLPGAASSGEPAAPPHPAFELRRSRLADIPSREVAQGPAETGSLRQVADVFRTAVADLGRIARRAWRRRGGGPTEQPPAPIPVAQSAGVVAALLRFGAELEVEGKERRTPLFTPDTVANSFLLADPYAFLVAVVCDYQMKAERAWELPYLLAQRLGEWSPEYVAEHRDEVVAAFVQPPALHRFPTQTADWVVENSAVVLDEYGGDASRIWSDQPTAAELQARFHSLRGISQKKAAMAVEILERDLGVPVRDMHGSDVAYDVHIRRVFVRTGLAKYDDQGHMIAVARQANPARPGALDLPAWVIGREWCRPTGPVCDACAIGDVCARFISAADGVNGA
jgi:uncharacterized HhH-GPD family protein